jgi:hypothetical protein
MRYQIMILQVSIKIAGVLRSGVFKNVFIQVDFITLK